MKKNISIFKELSEAQQKNTLGIISDFAGELAKEELVKKLEDFLGTGYI